MSANLFKRAFSQYVGHFWKFLVVDAFFLFLSSLLFIFARGRVMVMLARINQYAGDIQAMQQQLQESTASTANLESLLATIGPLATKLNLFVFFVVPLFFFLFWCLLQHVNYALLLEKKWFDVRLMGKMLLYTLIPFALAVYALNKVLVVVGESGLSWRFYFWVLFGFFMLYLVHVAYPLLKEHVKKGVRKWLLILLIKSQVLLPLFALFAFFWLLLLFLTTNIVVLYIAGGSYLSVSVVVASLAGLLVVGYLRTALFLAEEMKH